MAATKEPVYSSAPTPCIDTSRLRDTRFIEQERRLYPYRDALGRVNLNLVNSSLAEAEVDCAQQATVDRLRAWQRHAVRSLARRPKDEQMTLDEILDESENEDPDDVPKTIMSSVSRKSSSRRLFRAPKTEDEPLFEDEAPEADRMYLCRVQNEGAAKRAVKPSRKRQRQRRSERLNAAADEAEAEEEDESSQGTSADDEIYEVEAILDEDVLGGRGFLIRWAGYGPSADSWEPEWNLSEELVQTYRTERTLTRQHVGDDYLLGRQRMLWCASCRTHFAADSFSAQQRRCDASCRTCLVHHYKTETPRLPVSFSSGAPMRSAAGRSPLSTPARATGVKRPLERSPASRGSTAPPPPPLKAARPVAFSLSQRHAALDLGASSAPLFEPGA